MVVNALVTGMIVFRIHKVTGARPSTLPGGNKVRHIMFIIIESGMALFAIQLVRGVLLLFFLYQSQWSRRLIFEVPIALSLLSTKC